MKKKLYVVKIGGNVIDAPAALKVFLNDFSKLDAPKILVHGGGKLTDKLAAELHHEQVMIDGRRVTDEKTLELATMVYAGWVSKTITTQLQALQCNAIGLCGADLNLISATKRMHPQIDYGFVGDVSAEQVNKKMLQQFLALGVVPVFSAITHNSEAQLLNTNADAIARVISMAMSHDYEVHLLYCFEKAGVLENPVDESSVIPVLNKTRLSALKENNAVSKGMLPKLENAFFALENNVKQVSICSAKQLADLSAVANYTRLQH